MPNIAAGEGTDWATWFGSVRESLVGLQTVQADWQIDWQFQHVAACSSTKSVV